MALALLFSLTVVSAGFATLRTLGLAKGAVGLGLAPPAGLAILTIVSSWCMLLGFVPLVAGGFVFAGVQVPLSPHDSAFHVETIHAYRQGGAWTGWYPPGLAALFASWLAA